MSIRDKRDSRKFSISKAAVSCSAAEPTNTISFRYISDIDKYSVRAFKKGAEERYSAFLDKLRIISTLTWPQFWEQNRQNGGLEKIPQKKISRPFINSLNISEDTTLYSTRFSDCRLIFRKGTKCGRVIHILGIDLDLSLYKH